MASAEQLKALLKSHLDGDEQRFFSVAMQVAAHEAKVGHGKLAQELRDLIDKAKRRRSAGAPIPISKPRGELAGLLSVSYPKARLNHMVLEPILAEQLQRVIREQRHAERLLEHGLSPRRKLLLVGAPGTGKTMTASVLAGELGVPLFQVRLDGLITKYMGETAAKLRQVFDATAQSRGVYFFDEFDAIGSQRGLSNDVGEIRRVLNSFLQMIEQDQSHSLILAATNHVGILDHALFRRFDDVMQYSLPDTEQIATLLKARLAAHATKSISWANLAKAADGLSFADITCATEDVLKEAIIDRNETVTQDAIHHMICERQNIRGKMRGNFEQGR
jgi:SpoVK/Ycf46/Vps4 family AAA+-type ATPase